MSKEMAESYLKVMDFMSALVEALVKLATFLAGCAFLASHTRAFPLVAVAGAAAIAVAGGAWAARKLLNLHIERHGFSEVELEADGLE